GMAGRLPSLARAVEPPHAPEPEPGSAGLHSPAHTPELEHPVPPTQQKHAPDAPPRSEGLSTPAHSSGSGMESLPDAVASEIVRVAEGFPQRVEIDPEAVQRDLARLVLTIVELLRRVVEHQAVRRMDDPTLSEA